ncbi:MAG: hypothetical protein IJ363_13865 [Clostridia bacterium]|nr:hypothetical protein [Clostridia bacterium]
MNYEQKYNEALERAQKATRAGSDVAMDIVQYIFPELRESEDERMLRTIIRGFENWKSNGNLLFNLTDVDDILAYLERQKEPKWGEEEERILKGIIGKIDHDQTYGVSKMEMLLFLKSLRPQPKPEWSEEDEKMIKSILFVLESFVSHSESASSPSLITTYPTYHKEIDWLKSLRPQPKPEWSEEDEDMIQDIIASIDDEIAASDFHEMENWLKSLRPSWKPSEAHLSALLAIFNDPNNIGSQTCQLALTDLYEQLKKLKEDNK